MAHTYVQKNNHARTHTHTNQYMQMNNMTIKLYFLLGNSIILGNWKKKHFLIGNFGKILYYILICTEIYLVCPMNRGLITWLKNRKLES